MNTMLMSTNHTGVICVTNVSPVTHVYRGDIDQRMLIQLATTKKYGKGLAEKLY